MELVQLKYMKERENIKTFLSSVNKVSTGPTSTSQFWYVCLYVLSFFQGFLLVYILADAVKSKFGLFIE